MPWRRAAITRRALWCMHHVDTLGSAVGVRAAQGWCVCGDHADAVQYRMSVRHAAAQPTCVCGPPMQSATTSVQCVDACGPRVRGLRIVCSVVRGVARRAGALALINGASSLCVGNRAECIGCGSVVASAIIASSTCHALVAAMWNAILRSPAIVVAICHDRWHSISCSPSFAANVSPPY